MSEALWRGWRSWKDKSSLEEAAIRSMLAAERLLVEHVPEDELVSIYVRGSFTRRDLVPGSDVDMVVVLASRRSLPLVERLAEYALTAWEVRVETCVFTLWELRTGRSVQGKHHPSDVFLFSTRLQHSRLVFGRDVSAFPLKRFSEVDLAKGKVRFVRSLLKRPQESGWWRWLLKHSFHLVELEQFVRGRNPPRKRSSLAAFVGDEDHIIHDIVHYLNRGCAEPEGAERRRFIRRLKRYLRRIDVWLRRDVEGRSLLSVWFDSFAGLVGSFVRRLSPWLYRFLKRLEGGGR